jgi:hypothetical protein
MKAGSVPTSFEVCGAHLGVGQQLGSGAAEHDPPGLHHIAAMSQPQRMMGVLLDEEHGHVLPLVDLADDAEDLLDDQRRQAERRLVEQQEAGPAHQCARDRQHLLLAARQRTAALPLPLLQDRE